MQQLILEMLILQPLSATDLTNLLLRSSLAAQTCNHDVLLACGFEGLQRVNASGFCNDHEPIVPQGAPCLLSLLQTL